MEFEGSCTQKAVGLVFLFQHQQGRTNLHLVCPWPPSLRSELGWKPRQSHNYAKQWSSTNDFAHIYCFSLPKKSFLIIQKFLSTFPVHLVGNVNSWLCTHIFNIVYKYTKSRRLEFLSQHQPIFIGSLLFQHVDMQSFKHQNHRW